jgi:ATP-dependent DNA helicase RecG
MLTADDIKLLVASGEGYNVEFKISVPSKVKELSEEVCAFANAAGGVLLIGVNDSNEIKGVNIDNVKRSSIQNSLNEISPQLPCAISVIAVDGKSVFAIEIPSGPKKPYVLSGAIYVRIGPNTQKLTAAEQMRDFFQQAERIYFDEAPCTDFNSETMVDNDFLPIFKAESHISLGISDEQLFKNLKLFTSDNFFKNGTVLFFGKDPESVFDKALIRCITFQGQDKRFIIDDKFFGGNLYRQFTQAIQWLRGKLNVRYDIEGQGGGPRKEIWEIPETVFKEAIINALSHRDYYDKGALIHIEVFDDRVEISNPGGLVSAIPESEFGKRSHSRNPLIFGLFARMHLVEQVGSGVGRIQNLMKEADLPEVVFQKDGIFTVILKRPLVKGSEKSSEKSSEKILKLLKTNRSLTTDEIAVLIGVSVRTVKRNLKLLQTDKKLRREGSDKSGLWIVLDGNS